jgi:type I restriction enzyme M protein
MSVERFGDKVGFIWSVADLLRGPYKPPQYGEVMLPLTVLRRLDCVLAETKPAVLALLPSLEGSPERVRELKLFAAAGQRFYNTSRHDLTTILGEPDQIAGNLSAYIKSFSPKARELLEDFGIEEQVETLERHNRLFLVLRKFVEIDLHPRSVPNIEMGYIFEELIRRFSEQRNEQAGDHFTPREVIRLMVNLIFSPDMAELSRRHIVKTLFDPACGTGGMLSVADAYFRELNPEGHLELFGQEVNPSSYAICGSDMLIKGEAIDNVTRGDSFTEDGHEERRFHYMLAKPPFGVDWKVQ